jgi:putative ABC transport system permease protein
VLPLSHRLQSAFESRLAGLPAATQQLLLRAALDGTGNLHVLEAPSAGASGTRDLNPAERSNLATVDQCSGRLAFRHPLIRSAVVQRATAEERRRDDVIYAPISTVIDNVVGEGTDSYTVIGVQAVSRDAITPAVAEVSRVLRKTHVVKPGNPPDFRIFNAADLLAAGKATARSFRILLAIVAGISLVIGGIGVMNIMLVTVTERTREIGIRKALGAETSDILTQFLSEAILLSGLGGLIGTAVGVGVGHFRIAAMQPVVSPGSVALSFGVSVLIGIFFGGYPATRAAGLTPIVALRYE